MRARYIGPEPVSLSGKVDGMDVTVTATVGEVINMSDEQKQLIEASGSHILVPPAPRPPAEEWDGIELCMKRSKTGLPMNQIGDWFLILKPEDMPALATPEQQAQATQAHEVRRIAREAEVAAHDAAVALKPKAVSKDKFAVKETKEGDKK